MVKKVRLKSKAYVSFPTYVISLGASMVLFELVSNHLIPRGLFQLSDCIGATPYNGELSSLRKRHL